ncbi:MAG: TldD/PmbA family protein [Alphaproteobacteria bacterium]|nr:TldD/PmbA family protein [Alphaproteobacteria bacterium]
MTTETLSSLDTLEDLLARAKRRGASEGDAIMFDSTDISATIRKGKPESMERAESTGVALRVFVGKRSATVSSSDFKHNTLDELADRAVSMAKLAPEDPYAALATPDLFARDLPDLELYDAVEPSPEWLQENATAVEDAALAVKGITNSEGASAGYSNNRIALVTTNGFAQSYLSSSFVLSVSVLAGSGTAMERDYDYSVALHREDLTDPAIIGRKAAEKTVARLGAQKVNSCQVPIIFDPKIAKAFIATFAGAISGAAIARDTSFLKKCMGEKVFANNITITDDPHIKRALGSRPFDAEGVRTAKRNLIENGILQSWLLDIRAANKLGLSTLGDASRSATSPPHPSSSNLYLAAGDVSAKELMADIKEGLYITDTFGSGSNLITGDVSVGAAGFWIENGIITHPVNEFTIAGNLRDMYKRLTPANDLEFRYSTNAPTIRIEGMTVAGK